ncbi:hypothetical protein QE152_g3808 [Popillia japonica]|uniref:Transposable element P transposase-like RNase H C-terminal domain-containing protein n=1 Tax=Popillia japonica TaxID=7064 RepID=A0AAW1N2V2_POPJA
MATQVFSRTVATAMYTRASVGTDLPVTSNYYLDPKACDTADVLMFFDTLFDSVNGNNLYAPPGKPLRSAVTENSGHVSFWQSSIPILQSMYFIQTNRSREIRIPSLRNWIFSLRGFIYLSKKLLPTVKYLPMRVFNQDPVENFFPQVRSHSVRNPTCSVFINTFKSLIVNNLTGARCVGGNCEEDESSGPLANFKEFLETDSTISIPSVQQTATIATEQNPTLLQNFATPYVAGDLILVYCVNNRWHCLSDASVPSFLSLLELIVDSDADPAYEEVSEHATDSEQELEDVEITECEQQAHTYKGKDGMEWSTACPRKKEKMVWNGQLLVPVKMFAHEIIISSVICLVQEEVLVLLRHHYNAGTV